MIGSTIFVGHYALTWEILIDKDVVRGAMRAIGKYVFLWVGVRNRIRL
jgi:hypothetical protein